LSKYSNDNYDDYYRHFGKYIYKFLYENGNAYEALQNILKILLN